MAEYAERPENCDIGRLMRVGMIGFAAECRDRYDYFIVGIRSVQMFTSRHHPRATWRESTRRKSAILALPGARSIEVTGSVEVFNEAGRLLGAPQAYALEIVGFLAAPISVTGGLRPSGN